MKALIVFLALTSANTAFAAPNVCTLAVTNSAGRVIQKSALSCDGEPIQYLEKISSLTMEEISGQVSRLYASGLHLINCQVIPANGSQYICTVAR